MAFILALSLPDRNVYTALAADTKDVANASPTDICYETDTGDEYKFNGAEWKKIGTTTSSGEAAGLRVVELNNLISGEDQTNDVTVVEQGQFTHKYSTAAETLDLSQNAGAFLHAIVVGNATLTGAVTIYDDTTGGATTIVGLLPASAVGGTYTYNCALTNGLQIVKANAADDITVIYRASTLD